MVLSIIFLEDKHKILLHLSIFYEYQQFFQHRIRFSILSGLIPVEGQLHFKALTFMYSIFLLPKESTENMILICLRVQIR
jgi:hypothetical protein